MILEVNYWTNYESKEQISVSYHTIELLFLSKLLTINRGLKHSSYQNN
jgi:hypothetical protein